MGDPAVAYPAQERITAISISEPMIDTTIEPRQPRRFEKKANIRKTSQV
jgi:hypothetical protein